MLEFTYSNRIEELFERMALRAKETGPFVERVVIAPSHALKVWLKEQMALSPLMGTSLGCKVLLFEEALHFLKKPLLARTPSLIEMISEIEGKLAVIDEVKGWVAKSDSRKYHLAEEIALLFQKYGRFSPNCLKGWQKTLWDELFSGLWAAPGALLCQPFTGGVKPTEVDVFAIDFLSKNEFSFLKKVAEIYPVRVWHLSPCLHYWSDIASKKEKKRLLERTPELEPFMSDVNPLLANLGKVGREMAKRYEEEEFEAAYSVASEVLRQREYDVFEGAVETVEEPATTLTLLQADLLFMATSSHLKTFDDTLAIHHLPSRLREVEWVRDLVMQRLYKGETDILILAPDITLYKPLIERVFSDLPFSLEKSQQEIDDDPLIRLLEYYLSRRDANDLLPLLKEFEFDAEETLQLQAWMGSDQVHKKGIEPLLLRFMKGSLNPSSLDLVTKFEAFLRLIRTHEPTGEKSYAAWAAWLENLRPCELPLILCKGPISYYSFVQLVRWQIGASQEKRREHRLGQIRFASLTSLQRVPVGCLMLMGLSEGVFPRKPIRSQLDLSASEDSPSRTDEDRMRFLDALLSARRHLFITWSEAESPSCLVQELIDYTGLAVEKHPELPWDAAYFGKYQTFSDVAWRAFHVEPHRIHAPMTFSSPVCEAPLEPLSLRELAEIIKDPIAYYQKEAGLTKTFEEENLDPEMSDTLSGLEAWKVRKHILERQRAPYFNGDTLGGKLKRKQEEKIRAEIQPYLEEIGDVWAEPVIPTAECPVHGVIPYATKRGIVFLGEKKKALQALPYLLFAKKNQSQRNVIYCLKDQKTLELDSLPSWESWLAYAKKAKEHLYPFAPDCLKAILKGDEKSLALHLKSRGIENDPKSLIEEYQKEAEHLFREVYEIL